MLGLFANDDPGDRRNGADPFHDDDAIGEANDAHCHHEEIDGDRPRQSYAYGIAR